MILRWSLFLMSSYSTSVTTESVSRSGLSIIILAVAGQLGEHKNLWGTLFNRR